MNRTRASPALGYRAAATSPMRIRLLRGRNDECHLWQVGHFRHQTTLTRSSLQAFVQRSPRIRACSRAHGALHPGYELSSMSSMREWSSMGRRRRGQRKSPCLWLGVSSMADCHVWPHVRDVSLCWSSMYSHVIYDGHRHLWEERSCPVAPAKTGPKLGLPTAERP